MTKSITHLDNGSFNPVCMTKRRNIDMSFKRELVDCEKCIKIIDKETILKMNTELNKVLSKFTLSI